MEFVKAHGAGNDFVLLPDPDDRLVLDGELVRALCDRHRGIGADGIIRLAPHHDADVFMDYRNADGSLAETCGNGIRCVAKHHADRGLVRGDEVRVATRAGLSVVSVHRGADGCVDAATVGMGRPVPLCVDLLLQLEGADVHVTTVSMGNPHCVLVVDDVAAAPLEDLGRALQAHEEFPDSVNVEVIAVAGPDRLRGRILERGVGETLASGSGASAMAVAGHLLGLVGRSCAVELPGGTIDVVWGEDELTISGPAVEVAAGTVDPALLTRALAHA